MLNMSKCRYQSLVNQAARLGLRPRSKPCFNEISNIFDVLLPVLEGQIHELAEFVHHFLDGVVVDHQGSSLAPTQVQRLLQNCDVILNLFVFLFGVIRNYGLEHLLSGQAIYLGPDICFHCGYLVFHFPVVFFHGNVEFND